MVQIPLRRAHRLRAISLASATKKLRPQATERTPTAWHANDEYINAEASEEASASSTVANVSEKRILPIPTPLVTGYINPVFITVSARWGPSMTDLGPPGGLETHGGGAEVPLRSRSWISRAACNSRWDAWCMALCSEWSGRVPSPFQRLFVAFGRTRRLGLGDEP